MNPVNSLGAVFEFSGQKYGVHFSIYSQDAVKLYVAVYDSQNNKLKTFKALTKDARAVWRVYVEGVSVGDYYVYHVDLPNKHNAHPMGFYLNSRGALVDPYAKQVKDTQSRCGLPQFVGVIVADEFDWQAVVKPTVPWLETIIYEAHVKGLTQLCEPVPEEIRGSYLGVCHPFVIEHLKSLGITTLELMPCQAMLDEPWLAKKGLTNYWGYNPLSFMALTDRYSINDTLHEFKTMVRELHRAGIEVVVDMVFNHTAEGDETGPIISFKGIDPYHYYLTKHKEPGVIENYTGCGNTLDARNPRVVQLWMDVLRYWYQELGVDGFRFDLGVTLGRRHDLFDRHHPFFVALQQDPVLQSAKLIFEPWDLGPHGYQVGKFPTMFAEWNGAFRDTVRSYVRGDGGVLQEFVAQFVSNFDRHFHIKDRITSSINFITAHDGFTLQDLVSYQDKHNEANKENNRDGCSHNVSRNYGFEGQIQDEAINRIRNQQKRNLLTVLALAKGIPMLLMGDELSRTQQGNNNAYCQDNEISWFNWQADKSNDLTSYWKRLISLRTQSLWIYDSETCINWYRPDGAKMEKDDWEKWYARSVACLFLSCHGELLYLIFNMHDGDIEYSFPTEVSELGDGEKQWICFLDTSKQPIAQQIYNDKQNLYIASAHSISIFLKKTD